LLYVFKWENHSTGKSRTMSELPPICVTSQDFERLQAAMARYAALNTELLDEELARAVIVEPNQVAPNVVTMNSEISYRELESGQTRQVRLVYPDQADANRGWISVLAPLGSALLGLRVGQEITWPMPSGERRLAICEITYQPEAAGDWDL
jgi:regulator of nucleoside diphosphate kinase